MVRNYADLPVDPKLIATIVENARRAPSAGFSQGQSFVVVTEPDLRREIANLANEPSYVEAGFDPWISRAPALVVVCTNEEIYHDRYRQPDKIGPDGEIHWPVPYWFVDAGCSLMLLLLGAVDAGLAAGFLGFPSDEKYESLKQLLNIPTDVTPIGLVTIGHPASDRKSGSLKRGWREPTSVVHFEKWSG